MVIQYLFLESFSDSNRSKEPTETKRNKVEAFQLSNSRFNILAFNHSQLKTRLL